MLQNCVIGDNGIVSQAGALAEALALQTSLATSEIRLFQAGEVTIGPFTTLAELDAAQADYTGYTAGGVEVAAFNDPYYDAEQSAILLTSPLVQFNMSDTLTVTNSIGGAYLVDADGKLRGICEFDAPQPMESALDSIPVVFTRKIPL